MSGAVFSRRPSVVDTSLTAVAFILTLAGCGSETAPTAAPDAGDEPKAASTPEVVAPVDNDPPVASAALVGDGVTGTVLFAQADNRVTVTTEVEGAPPGPHGLHIHEVGDCSAADFTSAGGHFNPAGSAHAGPTDEERHAGDLGNLQVADDGSGSVEVSSDLLSLDESEAGSVLGRAVILHAAADDLTSQPTGAAGGRIACGVIGWQGVDAEQEEWKEGEVSFEGDEPGY